MDDVKHPHANTEGQIDVSSIRHCLREGDAKLALKYCHELLAKDPQNIQILLFATLASRSLGWLNDALDFVNRALALAPNQPAVHSLLGDILLLQKQPEQALSALLKAKELGGGSSQISFHIGSAYLALARYEDAKIYFDQALTIDSLMVAAHVNKGLAEHSLMNLDAALHCFDAALCIDPGNIDAQWNKSSLLLTLGRYEEGFCLYETRWKHPRIRLKKRKFDSKLWLGKEPLSGKTILLYAEGGFGDTIQFIRYAKLFDPDVELIIQCQLPLIELVSGMRLGAKVIAPGDPPPPHDFHCPLMSLPLAFGTTVDTVPRFDQYMYADPDLLQVWNSALGHIKSPKIGIMVEGSNSFADDGRGIPLTELAKFLPRSFNYILLHKNVSETELAFLNTNENWLSPCPTFSEAAAICQTLDSVISIDTSIAHLSAALGIPTTVLLPFRPDWRWGHRGGETFWYPSARLVRQSEHGNWCDVLTNWHNDCLPIMSSNRRD